MKGIATTRNSSVLYLALEQMQNKGILKTLKQAEKFLEKHGVDLNQRNQINFTLLGQKIEFFEYIIPQKGGKDTTFYMNSDLEFESGGYFKPEIQKLITETHISNAASKLLH